MLRTIGRAKGDQTPLLDVHQLSDSGGTTTPWGQQDLRFASGIVGQRTTPGKLLVNKGQSGLCFGKEPRRGSNRILQQTSLTHALPEACHKVCLQQRKEGIGDRVAGASPSTSANDITSLLEGKIGAGQVGLEDELLVLIRPVHQICSRQPLTDSMQRAGGHTELLQNLANLCVIAQAPRKSLAKHSIISRGNIQEQSTA